MFNSTKKSIVKSTTQCDTSFKSVSIYIRMSVCNNYIKHMHIHIVSITPFLKIALSQAQLFLIKRWPVCTVPYIFVFSSPTAASIFISCLLSVSASFSSIRITPRPNSHCVNLAKIKESSIGLLFLARTVIIRNKKTRQKIRHNTGPSKIASNLYKHTVHSIYAHYTCTATDIVGFNMYEIKC